MLKKSVLLLKTITAITIIAILGGNYFLSKKISKRQGNISVPQITQNTKIWFDKWAIPHIEAQNEQDAYFALGYIHAQDRLFQMEMLRRLAKGELSEIFGKAAINSDKFFKTLAIQKTAKTMSDNLIDSSPTTQSLYSYLDGINHFQKSGNLPIEFSILNISPKKFLPEDSFAISGYLAFSFSQSFKINPVLEHIKQNLSKEHLKDFISALNLSKESLDSLSSYKFTTKNKLDIGLNDPISGLTSLHGSNAWVISGKNTSSGKPILANDPHMNFSAPAVWYEAHITTPQTEYYGHHVAGVSTPILGHNNNVAWGVTMLQNEDVFFLKEASWKNLKATKHKIKVKDSSPIDFTTKESSNGPIVNAVIDGFENNKKPISMWWAFHKTSNSLLEAFYGLARCKSILEFPKHLEKIGAPGLNVLAADKNNNIAWWTVAKLHDFKQNPQTKFLLDASSSKFKLDNFLPFQKNPHLLNPKEGFIVSANHDPKLSNNESLVSGNYSIPKRFFKIKNLLTAKKKLNVADIQKIQLGNQVDFHKKILQKILKIKKQINNNEQTSYKALLTLEKWDGNTNKKEVGSTIYFAFIQQLTEYLFKEKFPSKIYEKLLRINVLYEILDDLIDKPNSLWWKGQNQEQALLQIWKKSIEKNEKELGKNINSWQWGKVHTLEIPHILGNKWPLNFVFNLGPNAMPGAIETINNQLFYLENNSFKIKLGPSTRRVIDFANLKTSLGISPTGQSGYFFDKHYKDQHNYYIKDKYRYQLFESSTQTNKKNIKSILIMKPA
jgi:penicillin G amidase